MNLARRIERLESAAGRNQESIPGIDICFVDPVLGDDGLMRPGPCVGRLRIRPGKKQQWLDADMKPVDGPT